MKIEIGDYVYLNEKGRACAGEFYRDIHNGPFKVTGFYRSGTRIEVFKPNPIGDWYHNQFSLDMVYTDDGPKLF